jgi:hypothetical protein
MGRFMPGARISQAHGTLRPAAAETGAGEAMVFAMYHPAAALRTPAIERTSFDDIAAVPAALLEARRRRFERAGVATEMATAGRDRASGPAVADPGAAGSADHSTIAAVATAPAPVGSAAIPASLSSREILGQADQTASSARSGPRVPLAADVSEPHLAAGTTTLAVGTDESGWSNHPADTRVVGRGPAGASSPEAEPSPAGQATGLGEPSPVGEPTAAEPQPAAEGRPAPDPTADSSDQLSLF